MPDLVLYTVADLRNWLLNNRAKAGLTERIISLVRAWALINNPYVHDDDPVVSALFVDGEVAAYTAAFPEMIDGERHWWFSSLWCDSKYRGQGYGLIVIGSMAEHHGIEFCMDRWGASDTVGIFTYLGHKTVYSPRYILGSRINRNTAKGKTVYIIRSVQKWLYKTLKRTGVKEDYTLVYLPSIDDETYAFMQSHRKNDLFFHSQEMLNWELQYSFTISAPLLGVVAKSESFFTSEITDTQMYAVQVRDNGSIVGFYMIKRNDDCMHLLYLYYDEKAKSRVFASIRDHIIKLQGVQFNTDNGELADYIRQEIGFPKSRVVDISFSYPESFQMPSDFSMQFGDGDNFAIVT